jgi:hypothetical protein
MPQYSTLRSIVLIVALATTAICCGRKSSSSSARPASAPATGQTDTEIGQNLTNSVLGEFPGLREGVSLHDWKKLHSTDTIQEYAPRLAEVENWCVRARSEASLGSGRNWVRTAYFYLPDPPTSLALPLATPKTQLTGECRLGLVWTEIEDTDAGRAEALKTHDSLAAALGPGDADPKINWWGSAFWRNKVLWKRDVLSLAAAITNSRKWGSAESSSATRVFVAAAGPKSKIMFDGPLPDDQHAAYIAKHKRLATLADEALKIAAIGGPVEKTIRGAQDLVSVKDGSTEFPTAQERTEIFTAIDQWLSAARPLPPLRRAAALIVADQLMDQSGGTGWGKDDYPAIRKRLEAQGAVFEWDQLGDGYGFTHTWLKEAWKLDRDGWAGELAFMTLMERGFETSGQCRDQKGKGFRAVIREGEGYLRRKADSVFSADIHLMIAQAYGDIVTIASGGGYDESETEIDQYKAESPGARSKAIEHYRIGFESAPNNSRASAEWPVAWRLTAGIPPTHTNFYCIYD